MAAERKIRLVLAEDEAVIRAGIARKITALDPDFEVIAQVDNGREALEVVRCFQPDAVLTDIKMPEMDGLALVEALSRSFPAVKAVILSGYSDFAYMQQAIRYGVCNYLLKPVETEALAEMLQALKVSVLAERHRRRRTVIYGPKKNAARGAASEENRFALFLVRIGNICYDVRDDQLNELYVEQQARIRWYEVLQGLYPSAEDWYVAEEEEQNQRLICYTLSSDGCEDHRALAEVIRRRIGQIFPRQPVTVATALRAVPQDDIWICARRLRNILQQKSVLSKGRCFLLEEDEAMGENEILDILKMRVNAQLRSAIAGKEEAAIRENLLLVFRFMAEREIPQLVWNRVALYILGMMEFSGSSAKENTQARLQQTISMLETDQDPAEVLTQFFMSCLQNREEGQEDLVIRLRQYLDRSYLTIENMEEVAGVFSYSYPHLSRIFSKTYGQSMSRYVQQKRMELAKQMIENNEELSISEIARICGFEDSRYFSRMFKSYQGITPTEYRGELLPQAGTAGEAGGEEDQ